MKTINNIAELAAVADCVRHSGDPDIVKCELTPEVVDFLRGIGGRNRSMSAAALSDIDKIITSGKWDENSSVITINASMTWMPCGHHRIETMYVLRPMGLRTMLQILPDHLAEVRYINDDVVVYKRRSEKQAKEFFSVNCAKDIRSVLGYINKNTGRAGSVVLPEEIRDYWDKNEELLQSHGFLNHMATLSSTTRKRYVPRAMYAIAIHLHDLGSKYEEEAWRIIDEVRNKDTTVIAARVIREIVIEQGQGDKTDAIRSFIKAVAVGSDNIRSVQQLAIHHNENFDKYREALRLSNLTNPSESAIRGSRSYYAKILRKKD